MGLVGQKAISIFGIRQSHRFILGDGFGLAQPRADFAADSAPWLVRIAGGVAGAEDGEGGFHLRSASHDGFNPKLSS